MHSITDVSYSIHTYQREGAQKLTSINPSGHQKAGKLYLAAFCRVLPVLYLPSTCLLPAFFPCSPATLTSMKKIFQRHRRTFSGPSQAGFRSISGRFPLPFRGVSDAVQDHYATVSSNRREVRA